MSSPWNKGLAEVNLKNTAPMPFEIPKGYKSMRLAVEMSLETLWAGQKKFLQSYKVETKKKNLDPDISVNIFNSNLL